MLRQRNHCHWYQLSACGLTEQVCLFAMPEPCSMSDPNVKLVPCLCDQGTALSEKYRRYAYMHALLTDAPSNKQYMATRKVATCMARLEAAKGLSLRCSDE